MVGSLIVIAHNMRSTHNVGSLMRTAEGIGVAKLYLSGYSPYPATRDDRRLPHISAKLSKQINKTALGAELNLKWSYRSDIIELLTELREEGYVIAALEQTSHSIPLNKYRCPPKLVLLLGSEVEGIESKLLEMCNLAVEIPMRGKKESFNVVEAASMAMYHCLLT